MITLGIDESGRGCLVGSMVISCVVVREENVEYLETNGVKDSKKIRSHETRSWLSDAVICCVCQYYILRASPYIIDGYVNGPSNLNQLERDMVIDLINRINSTGTKPNRVILDGKSIFLPLNERISSIWPDAEVIIEDKADVEYVSVAAASIVSKSARDRHIERIMGEKYLKKGSGYCNKGTEEWIRSWYNGENHEENMKHIRKSWKWWKKIEKKLME